MGTPTTLDVRMFKALADERRLALVSLLADGVERCGCVLAGALGMSDALVSHHVGRLSEAGIVETRRCGRWLYVRLSPDALRALAGALESVASATETGSDAPECCGGGTGK